MPRLDLCSSIEQIDFPEPVWAWLDLLGDMVAATQAEAIRRDVPRYAGPIANDAFGTLLIAGVNRIIRILNSIYVLLRCDYIDLAAAQVRMLCEALITLTFISKDKAVLATKFWDYYTIEAYELAAALIELERHRARREHVQSMEQWVQKTRVEYERLKPSYTYVASKGKDRERIKPFSNWCNKNVAQQAQSCGGELYRLYRLVYRQMSSYVHFSAFSLRHQFAYSNVHYDAEVVHRDVATIVRTTAAVWVEICKFLAENLDWTLVESAAKIAKDVEDLDQSQFGFHQP